MAGFFQSSQSGRLRVQEFRSSGTFNVPAGVKTVGLFMVGGGGGTSGATYAMGQGGNVVEINYDVSGKATCAVVIGAGGGAAGNGGDTSFDGVAFARGGKADGVGADGTAPTLGTFGVAGKNGFGGNGSERKTGCIPANGAMSGENGPVNTGAGGAGPSRAGGSGYLRVEWYE